MLTSNIPRCREIGRIRRIVEVRYQRAHLAFVRRSVVDQFPVRVEEVGRDRVPEISVRGAPIPRLLLSDQWLMVSRRWGAVGTG
jgi:hypothetical protein